MLQSIVNYAKGQYHLGPILRQDENTINFRLGDESCALQIARDYIELVNEERGTEQIMCLDEKDIEQWDNGNVRLQMLM
ncbi:hypothetical protein, partial [Bacillus cereus]|uniref:hypothetical protein n=1 Tax=Bacillus cereus TaxID=1396 RepID=UPI00284E12AF